MPSKIVPIQLMKGSKVVPLTPDEYARNQQTVIVNNTLTWVLTLVAAFLFLSTFATRDQNAKTTYIITGLAVAIASRLASSENVRTDRVAKDQTDGADSSRQSRYFQQTSIEQVPVEAWYEAMEEEETASDDYPHDLLCKPYDQDFIERFTLNRNSKLIAGAPGCGKTVTAKAWIATLFNFFPDAIVLVNYRKVANFCGLERVPGCTAQSRQGDLSGLFDQMAFIHAIHQARSDMSPDERANQPPAVFYIADYAATWTNIKAILGTRGHKQINSARAFMERMAEIVTVGRENNVQLVIDTQSFNLESLGNIDSNERGCLTTLGLGFESLDKWGQKSGNYEVIQLLVRNPFMVSSDGDREQLTAWLPLMRDYSQQSRQPLAFTTLGGAEMFFLPDYRFFEGYKLSEDALENLTESIQEAYSEHGEKLLSDSIFSGSDEVQASLNQSEPGSGFINGSGNAEPLNRSSRAEVQDSVHGSEFFTNRQLPLKEACALIRLLRSEGLNQTEIIEMLWGVKKGGSIEYRKAREEYQFLLSFNDEE